MLTLGKGTVLTNLADLSDVTIFDGSIVIQSDICENDDAGQLSTILGNIREIRGYLEVSIVPHGTAVSCRWQKHMHVAG